MTSSDTTRRELLKRGGGGLAGISLLGLAACGGGGSSDGGVQKVTFSTTPDQEKIVRAQIARFNARTKDVQASVRVFPADSSQYFDRLRTQLQAGSGGPDVIAGDVSWPAQFSSNGWIVDLSSRFDEAQRSKHVAGQLDSNQYQGKWWGVPWYTDCGLLYSRKDLLEKSGYSNPPTTWDELKEMAAKVTNDAKVKNGLVFTGAIYEGGTVLGTEFIRCAGGDVLKDDKVVIGSPQAIAGLRTQQSLVAEGIAPKAVADYKEDENTAAFLRGDAVFMRQWPYAWDFVSDKKQSKLDYDQLALSRVPVAQAGATPTNVGGGWNLYINAASDKQDAAWRLIQFMSAAAQQKEHALEGSYLPTVITLYKDPQVVDKLPAVRFGGEAVKQTTTPPVSPYYSDMSLAMSKEFNANVLGSVTPEQAAETLQKQLETIVERGG
jgi:multiple sugar transport system substrate-binding protein